MGIEINFARFKKKKLILQVFFKFLFPFITR